MSGVAYDGNTPKSVSAGKWWNGLDPHDLYAQNHGPKERPDQVYVTKFYNRVTDLINTYSPDILNFDDDYTRAGLPLYNDCPEVGLRLMAHLYNTNMSLHGGKLDCVLTGKRLSEDHVPAMVRGIEQGSSTTILPLPWQTETCLGHWHYDRSLYVNHGYAKSDKVMRMLVDIVSKNGNLLLSVPVRGNGSIDSDEEAILNEIGVWMKINGEGIYGSRPWTVFGEGPGAGWVSGEHVAIGYLLAGGLAFHDAGRCALRLCDDVAAGWQDYDQIAGDSGCGGCEECGFGEDAGR